MPNDIHKLDLHFGEGDEKARAFAATLDQISESAAGCAAQLTASAAAQDAYTNAVIHSASAADGAVKSANALLGATNAVRSAVVTHVADTGSRVQNLTQNWADLGDQIDKVSAHSLVNFSNASTKMFMDFITHSGNAKETMREFVLSVIAGIAQIVIRQILANTVLAAMHAVFSQEMTATTAAAATEANTLWAPPAISASIATLGGADAIGLTSFLAAVAAGQGANMVAGAAFAEGGIVPGWGDGDTVRARLTPGELVIDKRLTNRIRDAMDNRTFDVPRISLPARALSDGGPMQMIQQVLQSQRNMNVTLTPPDVHVNIGDKELDRIHASGAATDAFKAKVEVHADHVQRSLDKRRGHRS